MSEGINNNKRIAKNTLFLYGRMFVVLVVSLYTSRVVLNTLGVSDYGVNNVVGGFVSLFGFLNATLASSMQRFYNYQGGQEGDLGYSKVFSTGVRIHVLLAFVIFLLLESFGLWYINNLMVVDPERIMAANWVFQFSLFSMILVILQIPYASAIMAKEHMNFYAIVSIVDVMLKLFLILLLPYLPFDKLIVFGLITLIIGVVDFLLYTTYARKHFEFSRVVFKSDKNTFNRLISFSGWNLLGTSAFLLRGQGLNLILNAFWGTSINAARGVAFQVNNAIINFSRNINTAFAPQVTDAYSKNNLNRTCNLMFTETKICYVLILVLMVPVVIEIDYILKLWLGNTIPEYTNIFTVLVLIDSLIQTTNTPLTQVAHSVGKIKRYQIACSIVNFLLVPSCWYLMYLGYESVMVFIAAIIFSILNQLVCLYELTRIFKYPIKEYLSDVIFKCIIVSLLLPVLPYIISQYLPSSFCRLIVVGISDILVAIGLVYFVVLNKRERELVKSFIKR